MAQVTVKLFGVFRMDLGMAEETVDIATVADIFPVMTERSMAIYEEKKKTDAGLKAPAPFRFKDAIVYINGERCAKKGRRLSPGDEIWVMSPASGG